MNFLVSTKFEPLHTEATGILVETSTSHEFPEPTKTAIFLLDIISTIEFGSTPSPFSIVVKFPASGSVIVAVDNSAPLALYLVNVIEVLFSVATIVDCSTIVLPSVLTTI